MELLQSLSSPGSCPHLYGWGNGSVVREHYNRTGRLQNRPVESEGLGAAKAVFLLVSVGIMAENLAVLLAVLFRIRLRCRWVYICIANITLSDLLTGAAYVLNLLMSGGRTFRLSPALWLFREGALFVALAASIFSLLLVAVERYTTMMRPLRQKSARKTCRVYGMVALCWLLAFAIGFLPLAGWNCVCQLDRCSTLLPLYSKSYILFSLVIFFLILLAIGALYGAIYWHVRCSAEVGSTRSRLRSLRLLKTVITIVGAFVVCWGPLFFLLLVDFFCESRSCGPLYSSDWVIALAVLNSALNPVIYALGSAELRQAIASLLCCLCLPSGFMSKETSSTSGGSQRHSSLRNSLNRVRSLSPPPPRKAKKPRLSSTTSCLSVSTD